MAVSQQGTFFPCRDDPFGFVLAMGMSSFGISYALAALPRAGKLKRRLACTRKLAFNNTAAHTGRLYRTNLPLFASSLWQIFGSRHPWMLVPSFNFSLSIKRGLDAMSHAVYTFQT